MKNVAALMFVLLCGCSTFPQALNPFSSFAPVSQNKQECVQSKLGDKENTLRCYQLGDREYSNFATAQTLDEARKALMAANEYYQGACTVEDRLGCDKLDEVDRLVEIGRSWETSNDDACFAKNNFNCLKHLKYISQCLSTQPNHDLCNEKQEEKVIVENATPKENDTVEVVIQTDQGPRTLNVSRDVYEAKERAKKVMAERGEVPVPPPPHNLGPFGEDSKRYKDSCEDEKIKEEKIKQEGGDIRTINTEEICWMSEHFDKALKNVPFEQYDRKKEEYLKTTCFKNKKGLACNDYAILLEKNGDDDIVSIFVTGCEYGWWTACLNAGTAYKRGIQGAKYDAELAAVYYISACRMGTQQACVEARRLVFGNNNFCNNPNIRKSWEDSNACMGIMQMQEESLGK